MSQVSQKLLSEVVRQAKNYKPGYLAKKIGVDVLYSLCLATANLVAEIVNREPQMTEEEALEGPRYRKIRDLTHELQRRYNLNRKNEGRDQEDSKDKITGLTSAESSMVVRCLGEMFKSMTRGQRVATMRMMVDDD